MRFTDSSSSTLSSTRVGLALLLLSSTPIFASPARVKRSFQGEERDLAWEQADGIAARGLVEGEEMMKGFEKRAGLRAARTLPATTTSKAALRSARTLPATTTTVKTTTTTSKPATTTGKTTTTTSRTTTTSPKTTTTTTKTTTSAAATSSAAKLTSTKKGLGYNTASYLTGFSNLHSLAWGYNWSPYENLDGQPSLAAEVDFVPMLWGGDATGWATAAQAAINGGAKYLLGFNEPDLNTQSNLNATEAARLWKLNMEPFYGKAKLISPAITNGGAPMGVQWMRDFLAACTGCHIDGMAMHMYDAAWNTGYFTNYLSTTYAEFGIPIWLTEFAGSGTAEEQVTFLKYYLPWLEAQPFIFRYAAFGAFSGTFVNADGSLTALGLTYAQTV
ncbi:glycosyl hydrolase catalytic core-domain-containing protein [Leucosporidium creatinivorum]|uniref:Glycosyl hydrolase catalytic core-domain-containing protein n=1 Tax=Leucosporidium creatinivorum TaxID=106004 RepID=A0A1Y2FXI2_9BASI|nr:glycosyl hydrolase catalytic core-domain-containing protein [Leucosporidium creatinivorum]